MRKLGRLDGRRKRRNGGSVGKRRIVVGSSVFASFGEPLLTELRIVYVFHHVHSRDFEKGELPKFEQECDGLKRECRSGKISLEECNAKRFKLTKKYLPEECPEDWIKSIP